MYNRYYQYNSSKKPLPPSPIPPKPPCPPKPHIPAKPPCPPPKPNKPPKKKLDFKCLKKDTCKSLNDVEYFLNNFSHTLKYIRLINLLK